MNTLRLSPAMQEENLFSDQVRAQIDDVARRGRRDWAEIRTPGAQSGGFGEADGAEVILGAFLATFASYRRAASESGDLTGVESEIEWEIGLPKQIYVPDNARIASPHFAPIWQAETSYSVNDRVTGIEDQVGKTVLYQCVVAGDSGENEPAWPLVKGATVEDGEVRWMKVGYITFYEVIGSANSTHTSQTVLIAKELN